MPAAFHRLLAAADGSSASDAALALALRLPPGADLIVAHVVDRLRAIAQCAGAGGDVTPVLDALDAEDRDLLAAAAARAAAAGRTAETVSLDGDPAAALVTLAHERGADAIVMGTHGRSGLARVLLGSTAEAVIRRAAVPVIVTHANARTDAVPGDVLVALDASAAARAAVAAGAELARAAGTRLYVLHAVDDTLSDATIDALMRSAAAIAERAGCRAETVVVHGAPATAVRIAAEALDVGTLAMGARARSSIAAAVLGGVAEALLRTSPIPVLVVPNACVRGEASGAIERTAPAG